MLSTNGHDATRFAICKSRYAFWCNTVNTKAITPDKICVKRGRWLVLRLQVKRNWNVIIDFGITPEYKLSRKSVPLLRCLLMIKHVYWSFHAYFSNSSFWSPQNWFIVPEIDARRKTRPSFKSTTLIRNTLQYAEYACHYNNGHTTSRLRAVCLKCGYCRSSSPGVRSSSFVFGRSRFQTPVQTSFIP